MSGGGGGSGGGGTRDDSPCETLAFNAQLTSPQPAIVGRLSQGDVLSVVVTNMRGQVVVQVLSDGQVAGGLTGPEATRLRNCVDQGHTYNAIVVSVNGGQVRVRVQHK